MKLLNYIFSILILCLNQASAQELKIGVILPLTGPVAEYGVASKNGIELARNNNPDKFKGIDFVYEDSQYDAKQSVSAYRKLRNDPAIKLIYSWGSNPSVPLVSIAEKDCFPLIAADFSIKTFENTKCVIGFAPTTVRLGQILGAQLEKSGYQRLGLISVENMYINGLIEGLRNNLRPGQEVVFQLNALANEIDFRSHIAKIKAQKIDALGVLLYAGQIQSFYRDLSSHGYSKPTFGSDFFESRAEIKGAGNLMQGAVYPHMKISDPYYESYKKHYKNDSQVTSSGAAYDLAMMISKLFGENEIFFSHHQSYFRNLDGYMGVMGEYRFEESNEAGLRLYPPVFIKVVKDDFYKLAE